MTTCPVRKFVSELLQDSGYTVLAASSAADAIQALDEWKGRIDLLLTDIELAEGMSGIQFAEHLKNVRPDLKVLLMSGSPHQVASLANAKAFVRKPFAPAHLLNKIEEVLAISNEALHEHVPAGEN